MVNFHTNVFSFLVTNHVQNMSCFIEHQFGTRGIMLDLSSKNGLRLNKRGKNMSSAELERRTWHRSVCGHFKNVRKINRKNNEEWNQVNVVEKLEMGYHKQLHAWEAVLCLLLSGLLREIWKLLAHARHAHGHVVF